MMTHSTLAVALVAFSAALAFAGSGDSPQWNSDEHGVVLGGYDVVACMHPSSEVSARSAWP